MWLNLLQWSGTKYTISPSYACTLFCTNSWKSGIPIVHLNGNNPHFKCSLSICGWELPCWIVWSGFSITSTRLEQKFKLVFAACPAPSPQQRKPKNTQKNNLWLIKDARQINLILLFKRCSDWSEWVFFLYHDLIEPKNISLGASKIITCKLNAYLLDTWSIVCRLPLWQE